MKVLVAGIARSSGFSSKSQRDYDMTQLLVLVPVEPVNKENRQVSGHGFQAYEWDAKPELVGAMARFEFPCELELETETAPGRNGPRVTVIGAKPVARPQQSAA